MPTYEYECPANGRRIEVRHSMDLVLDNWGHLCQHVGMFPGSTPDETPIKRVFGHAPTILTPTGTARLKNAGFTKLVKRDDGVYENVTPDNQF